MKEKELKSALKENKVIFGSKKTIKYLKLGNVKLIVIASNCPDDVKKDLEKYTGMSGIELENFDGTAKQLGVFCGKPFSIASLAIVK
jgi:large subunit ribosomal protein L30e